MPGSKRLGRCHACSWTRDSPRELVSQLQGSLETTSGVVARPNVGGVQFRAEYVLDSVLCSDSLRDSSLLDPVVRQSLSLAVHPDLKDHLLSQGLRLPKRSTIYHFVLILSIVLCSGRVIICGCPI